MRDFSNPIIKFEEMPLDTLDYAFVINQDHYFSFILQSSYYGAHYEIKWKRENKFNH